ncbi:MULTISPECIES: hypothetical protein [Bacteroides]|jgi:uncharacterized membrane protein YvbJ|uniref:hypothetical protein n=1 Tax=Bacteroides TaxID=816 RepID=UPI00117ECE01|nr:MULTISPECIES: hypothetical protein [Bacteroides]
MALVKCRQCGHDMSDKAECCPKCGCPVTPKGDNSDLQSPQKETEVVVWKAWLALIGGIFLVIGSIWAYFILESEKFTTSKFIFGLVGGSLLVYQSIQKINK